MTQLLLGMMMLGYRPFLDPLPVDGYWLFLFFPVAASIALVYKAIKVDKMDQLPRAAAVLTLQILLFMAMAAALLWGLTEIM